MANFDWYLNKQGVRGPQGIQGEQGFSPIITVATNTLSEYVLQIQTQNNTFLTANLREHKDDLGGTYIRYNRETGVMFAGDADVASESQMGVVRFATATDIERETEDCVVSPADVADMIDATGMSGDITELQGQVLTNTNNITTLQGQMTGLLANYVPKSRTINGKALSSNITLTASDVNAYSKSETDVLLADKANVSDLPDMNNYYTKSQTNTLLDGKADISDIPTVGNGTITFTQGGVTKGTITTNQSGDSTIALDAAGSSLTAGTGIDITSDVISVDFTEVATASQGAKADTAVQPSDLATVATTGDYTDLINTPTIPVVPTNVSAFTNDAGYITSASLPDVSNMVTTDTAQTITADKTIANLILANGKKLQYSDGYNTLDAFSVNGLGGLVFGNTTATTEIKSSGAVTINRNSSNYTNIDSGNIGTYAITSNPVMTGADSSTAGASGLVPQPAAGDDTKFLCGDGTFKTVSADLTNIDGGNA